MLDIKKELEDIKKTEEADFMSDVVRRTLSKIIDVEKEALYGAGNSSKNKKIEKIIDEEFPKFKDENNDY